MLGAVAVFLLTLLGAAGESIVYQRMLFASSSKKRQLSLIRQGMQWYNCIPNMPEHRLTPLMDAFAKILLEHKIFNDMFFVV